MLATAFCDLPCLIILILLSSGASLSFVSSVDKQIQPGLT